MIFSLAIIRLLNVQKKTRAIERGEPQTPSSELSEQLLPLIPSRNASESAGALEVEVERNLENFTLSIALSASEGTVGLLGPSGSGKSMTLRMIAGVSTPDSGRIVLNGRVLFDGATGRNIPAADRRVGLVFQDYALFPHLTVAENVGFGLERFPRQERTARMWKQLESMGIAELANRYPSQISGGQRQRVGACAVPGHGARCVIAGRAFRRARSASAQED